MYTFFVNCFWRVTFILWLKMTSWDTIKASGVWHSGRFYFVLLSFLKTPTFYLKLCSNHLWLTLFFKTSCSNFLARSLINRFFHSKPFFLFRPFVFLVFSLRFFVSIGFGGSGCFCSNFGLFWFDVNFCVQFRGCLEVNSCVRI